MKHFIVYNSEGNILRRGQCSNKDFSIQAQNGESILEGFANDRIQKIVDGKVVDKTPEEIEADKPPVPEPIPFEDQQARVTNKQWQNVTDRLNVLEQGDL